MRGVTLIELTLAMAVAGLLALLGYAGLRVPLDKLAVEQAAYDLAAAHQRARIAAVVSNRVAELVVSADSLVVRLVPAPDTAPYWRRPGPAARQVSLSGPTRALRFRPAGISFGFSNATYALTRGSARSDVIVSRLGRVRIVRRRRRTAKPPAQTAPWGGAAGPGGSPSGSRGAAQRVSSP